MKKLLFMLCILSMIGLEKKAHGNDLPLPYKDLPPKATQFIDKHFPNANIRKISTDYVRQGEAYLVELENHFKLTFDTQGHWIKVDGANLSIPSAIIPGKIAHYTERHYPGLRIIQIQNEAQHYEVTLSGGQELTFERNGRFSGREN